MIPSSNAGSSAEEGPSAGGHRTANRLIKEHSPYLLQHAYNPVDWYPWCDEAFEKARLEDKPVLVSIGYSACHWCHVMERESFENEAVAAFMNEHFINIKVDREERPDVDHIYMDAVQAMTGGGGWPLNVFLTPDGQPFYGGTYFPPERVFNRPSWTEILLGIAESYMERRADVQQQAENLTAHLRQFNNPGSGTSGSADLFTEEKIKEGFLNVMRAADREWGGFSRAPKFPQTFTINFLLEYAQTHSNEEARAQALLSLDKMISGGIYDQIGGGFARYSTDNEWLAPHFEKMLYDNALLVGNLASAYQFTGNPRYREVIDQTLAFVEREMTHPQGGFYSALDADSEGEEGKFYVWDQNEVQEVLGQDAAVFCAYFDIKKEGNWEGRNILRVLQPAEAFVRERGLNEDLFREIVEKGRRLLFERRALRVRPGLDDKVLLGWNAMMNRAYAQAYAATGNGLYKEKAISNMKFLLQAFDAGNQALKHSWKNGEAKYPAFLDDYACLIAALIELAQVTADYSWLDQAVLFADRVLKEFGDHDSPLLYYTAESQKDVLLRKREIYDSATPSGNSMMAANLYHLSILFNRQDYRARAESMLLAMGDLIVRYPTSFNVWLALLNQILSGTYEIAIVGTSYQAWLQELLKRYVPNKLIMAAPVPVSRYPLLADKPLKEKTRIYLCRNYACEQPEDSVEAVYNRLKVKYF